MRSAAAFLLAFSAAGLAGAAPAQQPAPTPEAQRVVVPSLPDQKNKEGVVQPTSSMATDSEGYVKNNPAAIDPKAGAAAGSGGARKDVAGPGVAGSFPVPRPAPGPTGPAVVGAANLSVRGVVKAYEKGVSVTVLEPSGRERTVPLAEKATVFEGLKVGDKVVLRIPLGKPADGKSADKVEKQKPPKSPPKSKFSEAQAPAS
jgi:hypothetical protein